MLFYLMSVHHSCPMWCFRCFHGVLFAMPLVVQNIDDDNDDVDVDGA